MEPNSVFSIDVELAYHTYELGDTIFPFLGWLDYFKAKEGFFYSVEN
jgi:hypothetical protein